MDSNSAGINNSDLRRNSCKMVTRKNDLKCFKNRIILVIIENKLQEFKCFIFPIILISKRINDNFMKISRN